MPTNLAACHLTPALTRFSCPRSPSRLLLPPQLALVLAPSLLHSAVPACFTRYKLLLPQRPGGPCAHTCKSTHLPWHTAAEPRALILLCPACLPLSTCYPHPFKVPDKQPTRRRDTSGGKVALPSRLSKACLAPFFRCRAASVGHHQTPAGPFPTVPRWPTLLYIHPSSRSPSRSFSPAPPLSACTRPLPTPARHRTHPVLHAAP